jgi:hypothetical protein
MKLSLGLLLAFLFTGFSLSAHAQVVCTGVNAVQSVLVNPAAVRSVANPEINRPHVFCGEIKANGEAVGFHSRPGGNNPVFGTGGVFATPGTTSPAAPAVSAIYTGTPVTVNTVRKRNLSTFFPNQCTIDQVTKSIRYAYQNTASTANPYVGDSGPAGADATYCRTGANATFSIRMYVHGNGLQALLNSAYPN